MKTPTLQTVQALDTLREDVKTVESLKKELTKAYRKLDKDVVKARNHGATYSNITDVTKRSPAWVQSALRREGIGPVRPRATKATTNGKTAEA